MCAKYLIHISRVVKPCAGKESPVITFSEQRKL